MLAFEHKSSWWLFYLGYQKQSWFAPIYSITIKIKFVTILTLVTFENTLKCKINYGSYFKPNLAPKHDFLLLKAQNSLFKKAKKFTLQCVAYYLFDPFMS